MGSPDCKTWQISMESQACSGPPLSILRRAFTKYQVCKSRPRHLGMHPLMGHTRLERFHPYTHATNAKCTEDILSTAKSKKS